MISVSIFTYSLNEIFSTFSQKYFYYRFTSVGPTLPKVLEDSNQHDLEYPDIPSIPEENEEDSSSSSSPPSSSGSPINFPEFSPDIDYHPPTNVKPWNGKGILKKTASAM